MKKIKNILFAMLFCISAISCSFLDMPAEIIDASSFYKSRKEVESGLVGVYGVIGREEFYGSYYSVMASNVDDLCYFNRQTTSSYLQMLSHDASSPEIYQIWTTIYDGIKNANAYITALDKIEKDGSTTNFDPDGRFRNEARFLRAFYHFILAQAWGDVPLRKEQTTDPLHVKIKATPQYEVLKWAVEEMEKCTEIYYLKDDSGNLIEPLQENAEWVNEDLLQSPSRVCLTTMQGIIARVYLFMAGKSVKFPANAEYDKKECYRRAMESAKAVIDSRRHRLNPDYTMVFKNMMSDKYDTEYRESMWEADFMGDRTSSDNWSNGRIGDGLGLQSSGASDFSSFKCNFAYGQYNGTLKLWDMYWHDDLINAGDTESNNYWKGTVKDIRQLWNMRGYNYSGSKNAHPYGYFTDEGKSGCIASIDQTPYTYDGKTVGIKGKTEDKDSKYKNFGQGAAPALRNAGKFSREVEWEGVKNAKNLYNSINYPILRYSDVLLMYAEAYNEYYGAPSEEAFDCIRQVRARAGLVKDAEKDELLKYFEGFETSDETKVYAGNYDTFESFRNLVRNERGRELCFESLRKYDLIRWGEFKEAMNGYATYEADIRWGKWAYVSIAANIGKGVQDKHIVLPVPATELGVNDLLVQNPLW